MGEPGASVKPPAPSPRRTAIFPDETATARSTFSSWSKSADASHDGPEPTTIGEIGAGVNCRAVPEQDRDGVVELVRDREILLSVLVEVGIIHAVGDLPDGDRRAGASPKPPLPSPRRIERFVEGTNGIPEPTCGTTRSSRFSLFRSLMATYQGASAMAIGSPAAWTRLSPSPRRIEMLSDSALVTAKSSFLSRLTSPPAMLDGPLPTETGAGEPKPPAPSPRKIEIVVPFDSRRRGRACCLGSDPRSLPSAARQREGASRSPRRRPERPPLRRPRGARMRRSADGERSNATCLDPRLPTLPSSATCSSGPRRTTGRHRCVEIPTAEKVNPAEPAGRVAQDELADPRRVHLKDPPQRFALPLVVGSRYAEREWMAPTCRTVWLAPLAS